MIVTAHPGHRPRGASPSACRWSTCAGSRAPSGVTARPARGTTCAKRPPRRPTRPEEFGMKRLMIVADHSLVVHAIRLALRQTAGFQVVGFVDGRQSGRGAPQRAASRTSSSSTTCRTRPTRSHRLREVADDDARTPSACCSRCAWRTSGSSRPSRPALRPSSPRPSTRSRSGTLLREIVQGNVVQRYRSEQAAGAPQDCPLTDRELEILRARRARATPTAASPGSCGSPSRRSSSTCPTPTASSASPTAPRRAATRTCMVPAPPSPNPSLVS